MRIDLNSDLGEGFGPWAMGDDGAMLDVVTSANIACGGHAGKPRFRPQPEKQLTPREKTHLLHPPSPGTFSYKKSILQLRGDENLQDRCNGMPPPLLFQP